LKIVARRNRRKPAAGLQIFMPDLDNIPKTKVNQSIGMEWMKNRNAPVPPDVAGH